MKFELSVYPYHGFDGMEDVAEFARFAERLGYDVLAIPDHISYSADRERPLGGPYWDAITLAAHLSTITERIRICFSAIVLPLRHPVQLAREISTLDAIANGRIDLGFAVGWLEEEFDILRSEFRTRGARFDEYLQVMFRLWEDGPVDFDGKFFAFKGVATAPTPVQRPHPFVWIASSPPTEGWVPKSLKRAARYGDGWMPAMGTLDSLRLGIEMLAEELAKNGREDKIPGFPVFQRLGVWDSGDEVNTHIVETGGVIGERLNGDFEKVLDYLGRSGATGVTQTSVELPLTGRTARFEAMQEFSERVITPLRAGRADALTRT